MRKKHKRFLSLLTGTVVFVCAFLITVSEYFPIPGVPSWSELSGKVSPRGGGTSLTEAVEGDVSVHFIDVGQGDSILIRTGEKTLLIDAGENGRGEDVLTYLKEQGISKLDFAIGTHPHSDHIGGLDEVMQAVEVDMLLMPYIPQETIPTTKAYEEVMLTALEQGVQVQEASAGETFALADGVTLSILGPVREYEDLNNFSVVAKLEYGKASFLFTGDAETQAEEDLIAQYGEKLDSDVLKLGHHGSSTSTSRAFLEAASPQYAVICCGKDNSYGHPHKETLELLWAFSTPYYTTEQNGSVVFTTDGERIGVVVQRGEVQG